MAENDTKQKIEKSLGSSEQPRVEDCSEKAKENKKTLKTQLCKELVENLTEKETFCREDWIDKLRRYVSDYKRLSYADIAAQIYNISDKQEKAIDNVTQNIETVKSSLVADKRSPGDEELLEIVIKFQDHINLSFHQANYVEKKLSDTIQKIEKKAEKSLEDLKTEITKKAKETIDKDIRESERNHIAILGIFAAIILAFVASLTFSTSVLQNLHKASVYRVAFAIVLIAFFAINSLILLFLFIEKLVCRNISTDSEKKFVCNFTKLLIAPNIVLVLLLVVIMACWYYRFVENRSINSTKQSLVLIAVDCIEKTKCQSPD